MKFSLHLAKYYNAVYNSAPDPYTYGVDEIVKRIGLQLGAIEDVENFGEKYEGIVIAKVISCEKHPDADKLSLCLVDDGGVVADIERNENGLVQVVCGAPNVAADQHVAWIPPGVTVPASPKGDPFVLEAREIRGKVSNGMLASAKELNISDEHDGILVINPDEVGEENVKVGNAFRELYGLNDVVIDCENKMFTHRPDCFGNIGIARELAGIFGDTFTSPEWYKNPITHEATDNLELSVLNDVQDVVPRFTARALSQVTVSSSPVWLQAYLRRIGSNSINNIVDYTNYFMMLTGQPLHAFDYDKLKKYSDNPTLQPRMAKKGETLKLLNGKTIELREQDIVIATDTTAVALAGIMGGADTEVDENTKNIVLECANFDMYAVRRTSMYHGIFSDALTRFNKGQSPVQNDRVIGLVTEEIVKNANGQVASELFDIASFDLSADNLNHVQVSADFVNERLGTEIPTDEMAQILRNVEFEVAVQGRTLEIVAPFWRMDIAIAEDIVEEIGRLYNYQNIVATLPGRTTKPAPRNGRRDFKQSLRDTLTSTGANEVLTYSFVHGKALSSSGIDPDKWAFHLRNALSPDLQYYRTSLMPSLLQIVHKNLKAQAGTEDNSFAVFELGKAHVKDQAEETEPNLPREMRRLALVFAADLKASKQYSASAYYQVKLYLDTITDNQLTYEPLTTNEFPITAPYQQERAASVSLNGQVLGVIGEFRPTPTNKFKLPKYCAGFEIDTDLLMELMQKPKYSAMSQYPSVSQDVTLEVSNDMSWARVYQVFSAELAVQATEEGCEYEIRPGSIFQLNDKKKRITFHISLSHHQKTLKTDLVNEIVERVSKVCHETISATRV